MSAKELSNEKNIVSIEIGVPAKEFGDAINQAYKKNKGRFNIQGFRKGKAPRKIIEAHYGKGVFYEDAIDFAFPDAYKAALEELDIDPTSRPELEDVKEIGEDGVTFVVKVAVRPEVTLNEYKGAEIDSLKPKIMAKDVNAELKTMQEQNARIISDSPDKAKDGDTVVIDYAGSVDGVAFDGGTSEGYELVLGSGSFIPGFEDQLIGTKAGEEKDVKVTFPEEYHSEDLAGKDAVFKVTVHEVKTKELPTLDDEFAKDVSEFDTLAELKKDIKKKLTEKKEKELRAQAEQKVIDFAVEAADIDVPYLMVDEEVDRTMDNYARQIQGQGLSLDDYFRFTGTDREVFREGLKGDVEKGIKSELVLGKIAEAEELEPSEEAVDEKLKEFADMAKKDLEEYKKDLPEGLVDYIKGDLKRVAALDFLIDNATEVKEEKKAKADEAETEEV